MTTQIFLYAVLALLIAPGPTNTLMAIAGAQRGIKSVLFLIPFVLAGYGTTIVPLTVLGAAMLQAAPQMALVLKLLAALWLIGLAIRLWGRKDAFDLPAVSPRIVYLTTALNPKALIFGLVLLPAFGAAGYAPRLALFCGAVALVSVLWGLGGSALHTEGGTNAARLRWVQRAAALWLGVVAITLVADVLRAL